MRVLLARSTAQSIPNAVWTSRAHSSANGLGCPPMPP